MYLKYAFFILIAIPFLNFTFEQIGVNPYAQLYQA